MSKAILVMDMPKNCRECKVTIKGKSKYLIYCVPQRKYIDKYSREMHRKCPLREVPQKKEEHPAEYYEFGNLGVAFTNGYNACIDEILGKDDK